MKYYMGYAEFSFYVGLIHGYLFVIYLFFAIENLIRKRIKFLQFLRVVIASIIPFGTFFNDKMLIQQQATFKLSD